MDCPKCPKCHAVFGNRLKLTGWSPPHATFTCEKCNDGPTFWDENLAEMPEPVASTADNLEIDPSNYGGYGGISGV